MAGCDTVFHLQANADVRHGLERPRVDLEQNTIATSNVLEAMRAAGATRIAFSSTGSVYGEPEVFPTPEDAPFPVQTSLYAASKLAGEGLIGAYATASASPGSCSASSRSSASATRTATSSTSSARCAPTRRGCASSATASSARATCTCRTASAAILTALEAAEPGFAVYNLGTDESIVVDESIATICAHLGIDPVLEHTGGIRGWAGDSPLIHLDTAKIRSLGWAPTVSIREAVVKTLEWLER